MPKPRGETQNLKDPRGQLGSFLRHWIDRHHDGDESRLATAMDVSPRVVRYWIAGTKSPKFATFNKLAKALGFSDWARLAVAVNKHAGN